jgi:hypothetical protein
MVHGKCRARATHVNSLVAPTYKKVADPIILVGGGPDFSFPAWFAPGPHV